MTRARLAVYALVIILSPGLSARAVELYSNDQASLELGGYAQNLTTSGKSYFIGWEDAYSVPPPPPYPARIPVVKERTMQNIQTRLRLTLDGVYGSHWSGQLTVDSLAVQGTVLNSLFFEGIPSDVKKFYQGIDPLPDELKALLNFEGSKDRDPPTFFDWEWTLLDEDSIFIRQSIHRAYIEYSRDGMRLTAGRQRVAWGAGLMWNPTDIFSPVSPLSLEPQEKIGVDALSLQPRVGEMNDLTALGVLADEWDEAKLALHLKATLGTYDLSFMAGKFEEDGVLGFDFFGYIKDGGFYGEFSYTFTQDDDRDDYFRGVLGYNYGWAMGLILGIEYYYNGGALDVESDDLMALAEAGSGLDTLNENFLGLNANYELHALIMLSAAAIYDLDKGSWVLAPQAQYTYSDRLSFSMGMQAFGGADDGEYGQYDNIFYLLTKWDI